MSKCQEFLEGRRIEKVEHEPGVLVLRLDNGDSLRVGAVLATDGFEYSGNYSLDFQFKNDERTLNTGIRAWDGVLCEYIPSSGEEQKKAVAAVIIPDELEKDVPVWPLGSLVSVVNREEP